MPAPAAVFCGSVVQLSDGRVLSVGGTNKIPQGIVDVWLFDPVSEQWIRQPDTPLGRYYPTSTKLADGTVVVTAGTEADGVTKNPTVELYTPPQPGTDTGTIQVVGPSHVTGFYPRQWLMPDGNMLQVEARKSYRLDTQTWQWTNLLGLPVGNGAGSAGLMLPGGPNGAWRVLMIGGLKSGNAVTSTEKYDYSNPAGGWKYGNPMPTPRAHMNVVQVPDGSAYGIGGNSSGLYNVGQFQTMKYDPSDRHLDRHGRAVASSRLPLDGRASPRRTDHVGRGHRIRWWQAADRLLLTAVPLPGTSPGDRQRAVQRRLRGQLLHHDLGCSGDPCRPDGARCHDPRR